MSTRQTRRLQIILIPSIAFIITVLLGSAVLPFTPGFRFAWIMFAILMIIIFVVWELNLLTYRWLDKRLPFYEKPAKRLSAQFLGCLMATVLAFTLLFLVQLAIFAAPFRAKTYFFYLAIALAISAIINSLYVIRYLQISMSFRDTMATQALNDKIREVEPLRKSTTDDKVTQILVRAGNRELAVPLNEIAYFYSAAASVTLMRSDGQKVTTNYNSFSHILDKLPSKQFFQANRQYIIHRNSVRSVRDDANKKLLVQLEPALAEPLQVSRYRNKEFKEWFHQGH